MQKEIPILFSTDMVRAILAGNKTQTRRMVKPQLSRGLYQKSPNNWHTTEENGIAHGPVHCPYGKVGDLLWVRESFTRMTDNHGGGYAYKSNTLPNSESDEIRKDYIKAGYPYKWRPSIHMPKEAARIWLQVTDIRVERLQDISEEDCVSEGIECWDVATGGDDYQDYYKNYHIKNDKDYMHLFHFTDPEKSFQSLWEVINGPDSWDANPWVWVVCFKVLSTTGKPQLTQEVVTERAMDDDIHD